MNLRNIKLITYKMSMMNKALQTIGFVLLNLVLFCAINAQSVVPTNQQAENDKWNFESSYPGINGTVRASTVFDGYLFVGGGFTIAGGVSTNNIARFNISEQKWDSLGAGVDGFVNEVLIDGNYLYVGGTFTKAGGDTVNNIARFNLMTEAWESLGDGVTKDEFSKVSALYKVGKNLFVGGNFTFADGDSVNHIARFDTENETWHALGNGFNDRVYDIGGNESQLIVTGNFTLADGDSATNIVKYNIETGDWIPFQEEFFSSRYVRLWKVHQTGDNIYIGGNFESVGTVNSPNIVRYNTTDKKWQAVGSGTSTIVYDITEVNGVVYIGGFTRNGRIIIGSLLSLNTIDSAWNEVDINFNDTIYTLSTKDTKMFVGGDFSSESSRIAEFDILTEKLTVLGNGVNGDVYEFLVTENYLYFGGAFTSINNFYRRGIARINKNNGLWNSVAAGGTLGLPVYALETYNSEIYIGGAFKRLGKKMISYIAKFNPSMNSISTVEGGVNGVVKEMLVAGENLFVAGSFSEVGTGSNRIQANEIARFDLINKKWYSIGNVSGGVSSLAWDDDSKTLYIAGNFSKINEDDGYKKIAAFNFETEEWINLNPEMNRGVDVIHLHNGHLYAGGRFTKIAEQNIAYIAKYNLQTKNWSSLGVGVNNNVNDIISTNDKLYITGRFTSSGETVLNGIAKYNIVDETFYPLGAGLSNGDETAYGSALVISENHLYVGGRFKQAGGKPASMIARYKLDSPVSNEVIEQSNKPDSYTLTQNYPNPFNPNTTISYSLPKNTEVSLAVYDLLGKQVAVLINGEQKIAGQYHVNFDASNLASGMYFYRLKAGNQVFTKKLTLIK